MTKIVHISLLFLSLYTTALRAAPEAIQGDEEPLPAEEAFIPSLSAPDGKTLRLLWNIHDGYYMYREKFQISSKTPGITLGTPAYPAGQFKDDETFGKVETYRHTVTIDIPVQRENPQAAEVVLDTVAQGCADLGVCYQPFKHALKTTLVALEDAGDAVVVESPAPALGENTTQSGTAEQSALQKLSDFGKKVGLPSDEPPFLKPEEAFRFSAEVVDNKTVRANWEIADGYYLYRTKFNFIVDGGVTVEKAELPPGEKKIDENFGEMEVYKHNVSALLTLSKGAPDVDKINLTAGYQGCAEAGFCYAPMKATNLLNLALAGSGGTVAVAGGGGSMNQAAAGGASLAGSQADEADEADQVLASGLLLKWFTFLGWGLFMAFTPCLYPMIPILSSIIIGHGAKITTAKALTLSSVYVVGMAAVYGMFGAVVALFGQNIQAYFQSPWILIPSSALFVLLALSLFGFYEIQLPASWQGKISEISNRQKGGTLAGAGAMGALSALIVGPCAAPFLATGLVVVSKESSTLLGFLDMFILGLGLGLPLLLVGVTGGKVLPRAGTWMDTIKYAAGVVLLGLALVFLGRVSFMPPMAIMLAWATLFITSGVYMGAFERIEKGTSRWYQLWKGVGVTMVIYGVIVMIGGLTGARNFDDPLHGSSLVASAVAPAGNGGDTKVLEKLSFKRIKTVDDLQRELASAQADNKFTMLDFYADWCAYCKVYEDYVFSRPEVSSVLRNLVLLKADITVNDAQDQALTKLLKVYNPPTLVFFGPDGKEKHRIIGELKAEKFLQRVNLALSK